MNIDIFQFVRPSTGAYRAILRRLGGLIWWQNGFNRDEDVMIGGTSGNSALKNQRQRSRKGNFYDHERGESLGEYYNL